MDGNKNDYEDHVEKLLKSFIEVQLDKNKETENFLKIKETLTRIGIASRKDPPTLWQSCYILHKKGKYYIVHFKELFLLDGKTAEFSEDDKGRRNTIANLLEEWDLLKIINPSICETPRTPLSHIKIISFKEKSNWNLETKYSIGKRNYHKRNDDK
jgi:hypothetical protein